LRERVGEALGVEISTVRIRVTTAPKTRNSSGR
jgi:hypothetical protein